MAGCETCGGRGWVVIPDGGAGRAVRCVCQQADLETAMLRAGVLPKYLHCRRTTWDERRGRWPVDQGRPTATWPEVSTLTILGGQGSGKTHVATALLAEHLEAGGRGRWRDVGELLEASKRAMDDDCPDPVEALKLAPVLVLDDLAARYKTAWTDFKLAHLMRFRDSRRLPTILTASVTLVDIGMFDPGLSSRLAEGLIYDFGLEAPDRRLEMVGRV